MFNQVQLYEKIDLDFEEEKNRILYKILTGKKAFL